MIIVHRQCAHVRAGDSDTESGPRARSPACDPGYGHSSGRREITTGIKRQTASIVEQGQGFTRRIETGPERRPDDSVPTRNIAGSHSPDLREISDGEEGWSRSVVMD